MLPALQHLGRVVAHFTAKASLRSVPFAKFTERYKAYSPVAMIVLVGGVLAFWSADSFLDLADLVRAESDELEKFDALAHRWAAERRESGATGLFTVITIAGGPAGLAVIIAAVSVVLALKRRFRWLAYLVVTSVGGGVLNLALKSYFARARPDLAEALRQAHGYSFPSGHAMGATVVFGALSYLAFRTATHWRWKAAALAFALTLITAVAISRVYLGVHWISDVAAGVAAGTVWVGMTTIAYETLRRIRRVRSSVGAGAGVHAG